MLYMAETSSFLVIVLRSVIQDIPVCYKEESDVHTTLYYIEKKQCVHANGSTQSARCYIAYIYDYEVRASQLAQA